jgi:hypothetical protein
MSSSHPTNYEHSDADPRLIAALALGLAIFIAATPPVLRLIYPSTIRQSVISRDLPQPAAPRLEINPRESLAALHAREDATLTHYGWIDRAQGVAQVPIDRAMTLLAERGLAGWPTQSSSGAQ